MQTMLELVRSESSFLQSDTVFDRTKFEIFGLNKFGYRQHYSLCQELVRSQMSRV